MAKHRKTYTTRGIKVKSKTRHEGAELAGDVIFVKGELLDAKLLSEEEMQQIMTRGFRRIAGTRRRSQRTLEEIARLREENRAMLDKL